MGRYSYFVDNRDPTENGLVKRICLECRKNETTNPRSKVCKSCLDALPDQTCITCGAVFKYKRKLQQCARCAFKPNPTIMPKVTPK